MAILPPKIDSRDQKKLVKQLQQLILNYCPDQWRNIQELELDRQAGALVWIFARMMDTLVQRLNKVPEKNLIRFLDVMGINLAPARVARVPVTFKMAKGAAQYGYIPGGTQVAASVKNGPSIVYETAKDITIILPKLVKAISLNPHTDMWQERSGVLNPQFQTNDCEELFQGSDLMPHRLYLGHSKLFSHQEPTTLILDVEIGNEKDCIGLDPTQWSVKWFCYFEGHQVPLKVFNQSNYDLESRNVDSKVVNLLKSGKIYFPYLSSFSKKSIQGFTGIDSTQPGEWSNFWIVAEVARPITDFVKGNLPEIKKISAAAQIEKMPSPGTGVVSNDGSQLKGEHTEFKRELSEGDVIIAQNQYRFVKKVLSDNLLLLDGSFEPALAEGTSFRIIHRTSGESEPSKPMVFPDQLFYNNVPIDSGSAFYPFGERPKFNDLFYIGSRETFSKAGADVTLDVTLVSGKYGSTSEINLKWEYWNGEKWELFGKTVVKSDRTLSIEYHNSEFQDDTEAFKVSKQIKFKCPDVRVTKVNQIENYWIRAGISNGGYGRDVEYQEQTVKEHYLVSVFTNVSNQMIKKKYVPQRGYIELGDKEDTEWIVLPPSYEAPVIDKLSLSYVLPPFFEKLETVLTYNNFRYQDQTQSAQSGVIFKPFEAANDKEPALYLGFDQEIANLPISLFFSLTGEFRHDSGLAFDQAGPGVTDISVKLKSARGLQIGDLVEFRSDGESERREITRINAALNCIYWLEGLNKDFSSPGSILLPVYRQPVVAWEYWNGKEWRTLHPMDHTENFRQREFIEFIAPDDVTDGCLFGEDLHWIRARLEKGSYEISPYLRAIYTNTVWAYHQTTVKDEIIGSSNGQPNQIFQLANYPVLPGQVIMILETTISEEERKQFQEGEEVGAEVKDLFGNVIGFWTPWREVNHFYFSKPDSRHYRLDRNNGTIVFGDSVRGMIPPAGKDNIKCLFYQSGGGVKGNVSVGTITKLRTTFPYVDGVNNYEAADGGCEAEDLERAKIRGPQSLKNRDRAVTCEDYEWLVRAASTKVAKVKCLPTTGSHLRFEPGGVVIIVVPESQDLKPLPSQELIQEITDYLEQRAPGDITVASRRIKVTAPDYIRVDINAAVEFISISSSKITEGMIHETLRRYFHPISGGLDGKGWEFGCPAHLSEIYAVIAGIDGVDHITDLHLRASVQSYTLKLNGKTRMAASYFRWNGVKTFNGRIVLALANPIPDRSVIDSIKVCGFREGDVIVISNINREHANLIIRRIYDDVLECLPLEPEREPVFFLSNSMVKNVGAGKGIQTFTLNHVLVGKEPCYLKVALIEKNDRVVLTDINGMQREEALLVENRTTDTVFLEEHDLVYAGSVTINQIESLPYPGYLDRFTRNSPEPKPPLNLPLPYIEAGLAPLGYPGVEGFDSFGVGGDLLNQAPGGNPLYYYYHYWYWYAKYGYDYFYRFMNYETGTQFDMGLGGHLL